MDLDDSGWADLNERLEAMALTPAQQEVVIDYLANRLTSHFGTESFEVHLGKDDPRRHSVREVAAAALAHLAPLLDELPAALVDKALASDRIGARVPPPWSDNWRNDPRTASWRS